MKKYLFFFLSFALLSLSFGCKNFDDLEDADIISNNAEFAIPIGTANSSLQDLLEEFDDQTTIEIGPEGLITLRYFGDVVSRTSTEIIEDALDDLQGIPAPLTDTISVLPFESPNELEVDFATFSSGIVGFSFGSNNGYVKEITLEFPQATKNGETLKIYQSWDEPVNSAFFPFGQTNKVELEGYNLVPENGELKVRYDARDENNNRLIINDFGNNEIMVVHFEELSFSYIEGFLGNHIHPGERDTIQIEFLENWLAGEVYFEDPKVWIRVQNSFGIPTESVIEDFTVHYASGGSDQLESQFLVLGEGIEFNYPPLNQVGETSTTVFPFDKDNSNIEDILGSNPIAMEYKVDALTNPDTLVGIRGFLTDSSFYKVQVDIEIPIHGRATGFAATDTFDINFDDYNDVDWAEFKIIAENDIPLDIDMQFYFADENGQIIDSLLAGQERLISGAPVDSEGEAIGRTKTETFAPVSGEKFDRIRNAKNIYLNAAFSTIDDGETSVKIYNTQEVEIRMGLKFGTK